MPNKIINGTLFYAMEYFLVLNEITPTQLILKCDLKTFEFILDVFNTKYNYNKCLNTRIIRSEYTTLPKYIKNNVLILDTNTYKKCKHFIKPTIYFYSQNNTIIETKNTYGFYSFQSFNFKNRLKLGLTYHKHYDELYDTFSSSLNMQKVKQIGANKKPNTFINLMLYKKWKYIHNGFDNNNRFIVEARYFNKTLIIDNQQDFDDSIDDRYNTDINEFILDKNDILIQNFYKGL